MTKPLHARAPYFVPLLTTTLVGTLLSRQSGTLPGVSSIPTNVTYAMPSCGNCHASQPNAAGPMTMTLSAAALSVDAGAQVAVSAGVTGGPGRNRGGFALETDRGAFVVGGTTRINATGTAITHANSQNATWTFNWNAPTAPGLVRFTGVGQAINANGGESGDSWGFWGPNNTVGGVPFRLFVNATGVHALGAGCAGTDGHVPILGAAAAPALGQGYVVEAHNVPPAASIVFVLGSSTTTWNGVPLPLDLTAAGAPGCFLRTALTMLQFGAASGSGSGGGTASATWPIPQDPSLRGASVNCQALVLNAGANQLGITSTNALTAAIP